VLDTVEERKMLDGTVRRQSRWLEGLIWSEGVLES
jgi:hypothetical protein